MRSSVWIGTAALACVVLSTVSATALPFTYRFAPSGGGSGSSSELGPPFTLSVEVRYEEPGPENGKGVRSRF